MNIRDICAESGRNNKPQCAKYSKKKRCLWCFHTLVKCKKYPLGHLIFNAKDITHWSNAKNILWINLIFNAKDMRQEGIEPSATPWKGAMLPLHHWRCSLCSYRDYYGIVCAHKIWERTIHSGHSFMHRRCICCLDVQHSLKHYPEHSTWDWRKEHPSSAYLHIPQFNAYHISKC